jgi:hypothetical protein
LLNNIKNLTDQFHGLGSFKCRELAYKMAHGNNIPVPDNWSKMEGYVILNRDLNLNVGIHLRYIIYHTPIP